ncbi:MAG TPA: hypothetical protein DD400_00910 [Rhodospirillaceae bacterium]|nr:hypothetical protein [Rhodospirillaceae bacterium]
MKSDYPMQHLNPYRFYELAAKLNALFVNTNQNRVTEMFAPLTEAQALLDGWIKGDEAYPVEMSKAEGTRLLNKIGNIFNKYYIDQSTKQLKVPTGEDRIDAHEMALVRALLEKFEIALAAEFNHAPVYVAQKCGIYATFDLIEKASNCFGEETRVVIPEAALREFDVAGRALAFDLGSGAGMHLLRAIEIVLKKYYELFSGTKVNKNERSYAIYLKKLASLSDEDGEGKPDKRLLQMLAQIKEQYRNPLVFPESEITMAQATGLFGLATAAITLMVEQILSKEAEKTVKKGGAKKALEDVKKAAKTDEEDENYDFSAAKKKVS